MSIRRLWPALLPAIIVLTLQGCAGAPPPAAAPANAPSVIASSAAAPERTPVFTPTPTPKPVEITAVGSTGVGTVVEALAEIYIQDNPHVTIRVEAGGNGVGITSCADGTADIGMVSRLLTMEEVNQYSGMEASRLCLDGVAIVVNSQNCVNELSRDQVKDMYLGKITDWPQIGGKPGNIHLYSRDSASGTRELFQMLFLGKDANGEWIEIDESLCADNLDSSGAQPGPYVIQSDPLGITYMSLGAVPFFDGIKALTIDGIEPTIQNVLSGSYSYCRTFCLLTMGAPQGDVAAFISFCQTDPRAHACMEQNGYIVP